MINERDILGTQLIRRNDELALLYEKMKTQQRTISQGEIEGYRARPVSRTARVTNARRRRGNLRTVSVSRTCACCG